MHRILKISNAKFACTFDAIHNLYIIVPVNIQKMHTVFTLSNKTPFESPCPSYSSIQVFVYSTKIVYRIFEMWPFHIYLPKEF